HRGHALTRLLPQPARGRGRAAGCVVGWREPGARAGRAPQLGARAPGRGTRPLPRGVPRVGHGAAPVTPQLNLLPASYVERIADRRRAATTAVALVVVLVLLALAGFGQSGHLRDATHERDVEQARITSLRAQRVRLAPYRKLAEGVVVRKQ